MPDDEAGFITPENTFPLFQSPMAVSFTPLQLMLGIAHGDFKLVFGYSSMETHFMKLQTNSYCANVAFRVSLELDSECCNQGQTIFTRYSLQHSAVPFCALVWPTTSRLKHCCSQTFPFHNKARIVDRGSSSRADIGELTS